MKPIDLSEQSKRMEGKVKELHDRITNLDKEIADNYAKVKNSKSSTANMYKQKCMQLMK